MINPNKLPLIKLCFGDLPLTSLRYMIRDTVAYIHNVD